MTKADLAGLETTIEKAFEVRDGISVETRGEVREAIETALDLLDRGEVRVADRQADGQWTVNQWLKKAVLLSFRISPMEIVKGGPGDAAWWDKVPSKFSGWSAVDFEKAGFRAVPSAVVRRSAYIAPGVVLMPSFTNIGAHVDSGTMVDTWATVGSCAQIGRNVHLSGGVGIGGVLEPPNAKPVIIEDECLIGSRSMITDGARVSKGSVIGAGTILNPSIPVIDAQTGDEISRGHVPAWSVAVGGTRTKEFAGGTFGLPCVLVIKRLTEGERHDKASLNDILRDH